MGTRDPLPPRGPNPLRTWRSLITVQDAKYLRTLRIASDRDAEELPATPKPKKGHA